MTIKGKPGKEIFARRLLATNRVVITGQMKRGAKDETLAVTVVKPAQILLDRFASSLAQHGVEVRGKVRVRSGSPSGSGLETLLGFAGSPPLREIVGGTLKESDNLTASLLFAHAGVCVAPEEEHHPETLGAEALTPFLTRTGLPAAEVQIEEGSGLIPQQSRHPARHCLSPDLHARP